MSVVQELPQGWTKTRLGNVLPIQYGKGLTERNRISNGKVPVYGSSGVVGFHDQILTSRSTLVIGRKGSVGSVYYSQLPCWPIDTTYFVEEEPGINLKFFWYLLSSLNLKQFDKSTAVPGLNRDDYNALTIWFPPLPEQQRIVEALELQLSRLDAGVAALRSAQKKLKRYRASVLKAAVEGRLTEEWRKSHPEVESAPELLKRILQERRAKWEAEQIAKGRDPQKVKYEEPEGPDEKGLAELSEGWCWIKAEQLCDFITKGTTPAADKLYNGIGDIPFIKVYNLTNQGYLDFSVKPTFVEKHTHLYDLARSKVFPGDILMNIVGPPLGKVSVVPGTYAEWNINQAIVIFRPMSSYNRKFLTISLMTERVLFWAIKRAKTTAGQHNLTLEICRDLPLPLPPLAEQEQIVSLVEERLSIVSTLESTIQQTLKRAERMRQSILHRAFTGQLVAQDPNDEPASVLLERIRREREEATAPQKLKHPAYKERAKRSSKRVAEASQAYVLRNVPEPQPVDPDVRQRELWDETL